MKSLLCVYLLVVTGFLSQPVIADPLKQSEAIRLVKSGHILSLDEILILYPEMLSARVLDLELERDGDEVFIYKIEFLMLDGSVREYEIDAASGLLIREEFEE
jgi:uncharacterized membrane protein YkoI